MRGVALRRRRRGSEGFKRLCGAKPLPLNWWLLAPAVGGSLPGSRLCQGPQQGARKGKALAGRSLVLSALDEAAPD
eukprot:4696981-Pyramimonas_sp.AAC.1